MDGYPVTFIGMLAITLITSATTTSLKQHQKAAAEREKALAEADKENCVQIFYVPYHMICEHYSQVLSALPLLIWKTDQI